VRPRIKRRVPRRHPQRASDRPGSSVWRWLRESVWKRFVVPLVAAITLLAGGLTKGGEIIHHFFPPPPARVSAEFKLGMTKCEGPLTYQDFLNKNPRTDLTSGAPPDPASVGYEIDAGLDLQGYERRKLSVQPAWYVDGTNLPVTPEPATKPTKVDSVSDGLQGTSSFGLKPSHRSQTIP
jgi:hypothetical protein